MMTVADIKRRTPQDVERNVARASWREALRQARDGDLAPLHECLRILLPAGEYAADLTGPKGLLKQLRSDRKRAPTPEREAENAIIGLARYRIKMLQRRYGKPLPRGTNQRVIDQSAEWLAEDGQLDRADPARIDYERVRQAVRRGR